MLLLEHPVRPRRALDEVLESLEAAAWWAVSRGDVSLAGLAGAHQEVLDGLRVVAALVPGRRVVPVAELALERALVADPDLAAAAVDRWLGPIVTAPRGGAALLATLEASFAADGSVVGTARLLGVATRTVSYRLERIAQLLGVPELDAEVRARLVSALLIRRLMRAGDPPDGDDRTPATPAAPPARGRGRRRRC